MDHFRSNLKKAGCGWCWGFRHMFLLAIIDVNPFEFREFMQQGPTWKVDEALSMVTFQCFVILSVLCTEWILILINAK